MEKADSPKEPVLSAQNIWDIFREGVAVHLYGRPLAELNEEEMARATEFALKNGSDLHDAAIEEHERLHPEEVEARRIRVRMHRIFLYAELLPKIGNGEVNTVEDVERIFKEFKQSNPGLGRGFTLSNIGVHILAELSYDQKLVEKKLLTIPENYPLKKALLLLMDYNSKMAKGQRKNKK